MQKSDYFIACIKAGMYQELAWINTILARVVLTPIEMVTEESKKLFHLYESKDGKYCFYTDETPELQYIDGFTTKQVLFYRKEDITVPGGLINVPANIKTLNTTIGNVLVNAICFYYPLGTRVPFMNGGKTIQDIDKINPGAMTKAVVSLLRPQNEYEKEPLVYITVQHLKKWIESIAWLAGLASLVNPSLSEKSIRVAPEVLKRRDELYEIHKYELGNPAVQANIEKELVKMDKESLKDDPSFDFYYKSAYWENARKKQLITSGLVGGIGGDVTFIKEPLNDGIDPEKIPIYSDANRFASYSRGHLTALGGELVKYIFRVTQNIKIVEKDCGTKFGLLDIIRDGYQKLYIGRSYISDTKVIEITPDNVNSLLDKIIYLRSPAYCKTKDGNYCELCMGKDLSKTPNAIHTAATNPGSVMMNASMKAMHGKALNTTYFDFENALC